jgi:iron complex outermembrane receptor protein
VDVPAVPGYQDGNFDLESENDTSFWGVSLTADWAIGDYLVTSITSYDDMDDSRPEETDVGPNDILTGDLAVNQETWAQELRVAWEGDRWTWLAGAYYLRDEATDNTSFDILRDLRPLFIGDDVNCTAPPGNPTGFCPEAFVQTSKSGTRNPVRIRPSPASRFLRTRPST